MDKKLDDSSLVAALADISQEGFEIEDIADLNLFAPSVGCDHTSCCSACANA